MEQLTALDLANRIYEIGLLANQMGDLSAVLTAISRRIQKETDASYVGVVLIDRVSGELVHHQGFVHTGEVPEGHRQPAGKGVMGEVVTTGKPKLVADVNDYDGYISIVEGMRSEVAVPLLLGGEVIGALNVESTEVGKFGPATLALLQAVATPIALAVQYAQLFEEDRRRLRQLTMLNKVSRIVTSTLDLDELLSSTVHTIREQLDHYMVALALVSDDGQQIVMKALACRDEIGLAPGHAQAIGEGVSGEVVRSGTSLLIPDTREWFNYVPFNDEVRCEMCCPLKVGDRVIGTLDVESRRPRAFDYADLLLLESIADHVSQAIENARSARRLADVRANLVGMLVDDLEAPIAGVDETLEAVGAALREAGASEELRAEVEGAHFSCVELRELTEGLSNLRRVYTGDLVLDAGWDAQALVDRLRERFQATAGPRPLSFDASVGSDLPAVELDVDLLERALRNLLLNALKFTPEKGSVTLTIEAAPKDVRERHAPSAQAGVLFSVQDTGPGVAEEDRQTIFEKHGTGLGLAFCKNAVAAHGGAIWVDDASPGSVFRILIPRASA